MGQITRNHCVVQAELRPRIVQMFCRVSDSASLYCGRNLTRPHHSVRLISLSFQNIAVYTEVAIRWAQRAKRFVRCAQCVFLNDAVCWRNNINPCTNGMLYACTHQFSLQIRFIENRPHECVKARCADRTWLVQCWKQVPYYIWHIFAFFFHTLRADVRPVHAKQWMFPRVHSSLFSSKTIKAYRFQKYRPLFRLRLNKKTESWACPDQMQTGPQRTHALYTDVQAKTSSCVYIQNEIPPFVLRSARYTTRTHTRSYT